MTVHRVEHGSLRPGVASSIHVQQRWEVATEAERLALACTTLEVGAVCRVLSTGLFYVLTAAPGTWAQQTAQGSRAHVASAALSGHRLVYLDDNQQLAYASSDDVYSATSVLGMTLGAAAPGDSAVVLEHGLVTEPSWAWTARTPLFLGLNGNIAATPPTYGVVVRIGVAVSSDTVVLRLWQPILL